MSEPRPHTSPPTGPPAQPSEPARRHVSCFLTPGLAFPDSATPRWLAGPVAGEHLVLPARDDGQKDLDRGTTLVYGNFDIILDHLSRNFRPPHNAPCAVFNFYVVAGLIGSRLVCLESDGVTNSGPQALHLTQLDADCGLPTLCPTWGCRPFLDRMHSIDDIKADIERRHAARFNLTKEPLSSPRLGFKNYLSSLAARFSSSAPVDRTTATSE